MISLRGDFFVSLKILYNLRLVAQSINGLSSKNHDAKGVRNPYENRERTQCSMNTRSFIFFTRILVRAQISSLIFRELFIEVLSVTILETTKTQVLKTILFLRFYRSQFWRLQKPQMVSANYTIKPSSCLQAPRRAHTLRSKVQYVILYMEVVTEFQLEITL